jgi:hypothetical protein
VADARLTAGGGGRARLLAVCCLATVASAPTACAAAPHPAAAAAQPTSRAATFPDDDRPLLRYRSHRLALTLPLPDGRAWRIDDHSEPALVATHAPTRSRLVVSVFSADGLVGRTQCEELARSRRLVPESGLSEGRDASAERTVEDEVAITQGTFDTRVEVTLEPGSGPDRALGGRVMAFGGFLRKCYVFVYSTEVDAATDEAVLSSRLALVRARVLGGLELEPFDAVSRDAPAGPKLAPGP